MGEGFLLFLPRYVGNSNKYGLYLHKVLDCPNSL